MERGMATRVFRVRLFEVDDANPDWGIQPTFAESLRRICALRRDRRVKTIAYKPRRLENHRLTQEGCFQLNFTTLAYEGPSWTRGQGNVQPFQLNPDDRFAHETTMLYDPHRKLAFVETMQSGVSAGTISQFVAHFANSTSAYPMLPCLKPDAAARLREKRLFRSLDMRVALGPAGREDLGRGADPAIVVGRQFGAGIVDIKVAVKPYRRGSLDRGAVLGAIELLTGGHFGADVERLKVTAKEQDNTKAEVIDFLGDQVSFEQELPIDDAERKVLCTTRWAALRAMRAEHLRNDPRI